MLNSILILSLSSPVYSQNSGPIRHDANACVSSEDPVLMPGAVIYNNIDRSESFLSMLLFSIV